MRANRHIGFLCLLLALYMAKPLHAQFGNVNASQIEVSFKDAEIEFKKNEIVSNPLRILNTAERPVSFTLTPTVPPGWSLLRTSNRTYTVAPGDSIFIPFRVIPKGEVAGNTKYAISIMVTSAEGLPIGVASFFSFTKKIVNWEMSVLPENKIYLRNGENLADFGISMMNTGNYDQDFQLTLSGDQREDVQLMDTAGNFIHNPSYTLSLGPGEDTALRFMVEPKQFQRNYRTVSLVSHRPFSDTEERRFRFYAQSEEARQISATATKKGTKIDFVKLGNEKTISPFGTEYIPLIAEAQIQNILSNNSFMSMNLRGIKQFNEDRRLMYFTQLYYSQNYFNNTLFDNLPWYVGYFDKKWNVQVGNVSGRSFGMTSSGKGITGSYLVHRDHRVGGHFTVSPGFGGDARFLSYGAYHDYMGTGRIRVSSSLARTQDNVQGIGASVVNSRVGIRLASQHNLSLLGAYSIRDYRDTAATLSGMMAGVSYSGKAMESRLRFNANGRYSTRAFALSNAERYAANSRTTYDINQVWQAQLLNSYASIAQGNHQFDDSVRFAFRSLFNRINFSARTEAGVIQPGLFYDILQQLNYTNHFRGVGFTYSRFDFDRNTLYSANIKAGYNNPLEFPEIKNFFSANLSLLARVKTFTANLRYNYGPTNPIVLLNTASGAAYPQTFRAAGQHQYMFRNSRFILQSSATYSYNNQIRGHTLGAFPELYYFTPSGWRFSVNFNYTFTSSNFQYATRALNDTRGIENPNPEPTRGQSLRFGASIRKEFGIPIPFTETRNYDLNFVAFYDLDGDGKHGQDEPTIENVVLRIDNDEVLTNVRGRASMKNVPKGVYYVVVVPLDAPEGWFAEMPDSLLVNMNKEVAVPFVRGIKVFGKVVMDRDQLVTGKEDKMDLTNIKITATSTNQTYHTLTGFDGSFEFYMPNGTYTLTVDENVLTDRFKLLQNNIPVTLDKDLENLYVTFFIIEKRRKVNIKKFGED